MQTFLKILDPSLAEMVERYAQVTGTTTERCVEEAIADWIFCVATPRLQGFRAPAKLKLVQRK